jgi:hypothetical protein
MFQLAINRAIRFYIGFWCKARCGVVRALIPDEDCQPGHLHREKSVDIPAPVAII